MIGGLVPAAAVVVEADPAMWEEDGLLPEEALAVARAVEKRRREYAAGRACARRALARLGVPPAPLLSGADRAPIWPDGIVGAITHSDGYCAAAVAPSSALRSIGIDAEVNNPLPDGVDRHVLTEAELAWTAEIGAADGINWPTLIFSAKESVYKAWHPLTREWLGYLDAEVTFDRTCRTFSARLLVPVPAVLGAGFEAFHGRFAATSRHVFSTVAMPPAGQLS
jgi:4'-phosphopantetheinyl transferase EntD